MGMGGPRGTRCRIWALPLPYPRSQVLFNVASAQCQLGLWTQAANTLVEAISKWPERAQDGLDTALNQVQVRKSSVEGRCGCCPGQATVPAAGMVLTARPSRATVWQEEALQESCGTGRA